MLRGTRKNMIVVRTRDSRMFEEAYFVMRRDRDIDRANDPDILWEANRILESAAPHSLRESPEARVHRSAARRIRWRDILWFGLGLCSGGGLAGLCHLLL